MHGRLKVKSTAEQLEAKKKEKEVKLAAFQAAKQRIFYKRENGELDDEALTLTKAFLQENPDYYTLWNFRTEIFLHLQSQRSEDEFQGLCSDELFLTQSCLMKNPKSYGAWHHREWVLGIMSQPDWEMELKLCDKFLSMDERNFHCWDYRRSICKKRFVKPEDELSFTTDLIERNFSNYSAWHYRSILLPIVHPDEESKSKLVDENILQKEYDLVQNAAFTDPYDQSVWFYHRWLLGRGERPLEITMMCVSRTFSSVIIVLSTPEKVDKTCFLKLQINDKDERIRWFAVCHHPYACKVWQCYLAPDIFSKNGKMEITVVLCKGQMQSCMSCIVNRAEAICWSASHQAFASELSAATKDVLQRELDSCETLCELEPENKWSLFTCVLIMKALDSHKYKENISSYLERLTEVDPLRTGYYKDLKNKFIIEDFFENSILETKELSLVNQGLTSLNHFDCLVHIRKVDLSFNSLTNIHPIRSLVCVEHLILDDNKITDCEDLGNLKCLKELSLRNNCIQHLEYLMPIASCPYLEHLWIEGNPGTNDLKLYNSVQLAFYKDLLNIKQQDNHFL